MKSRMHRLLLIVMMFGALGAGAAKTPRKAVKPAKETFGTQTGTAVRATETAPQRKQLGAPDDPGNNGHNNGKKPVKIGPPVERHLDKASGKVFDLRKLPHNKPVERERPERELPEPNPVMIDPGQANSAQFRAEAARTPVISAAAPPAIINVDGLDREFWGAGSPPDTNGDVGPTYYIQTVNTSIGVFRKSDGFQEAAFTFDTFMSQGNFGNQCDNHNFGDPVVLYDTFEDRWIITDFAFTQDAGLNVNPPIAFQCFAVSMNGNPLTGGWNYYSIAVTDGLNDYPKFGIWPDGLYMSANMFGYPNGAAFQTARAWAFNKAQMYAGSPTVKIVSFDISGGVSTVIPSNSRLQTGTPPVGRPNYFMSTSSFLNALSVYKFHVDWNSLSLSTFTGPDVPIASTSWPNASVAGAAQPGGTTTLLDTLGLRAMMQTQYTNIGGAESLWVPHTVRRGDTSGLAAPRWYQVTVTGGNVNLTIPQATTWDPDGANVVNRFIPSLAIDRAGNMAMGYSMSNGTTVYPSLAYAGRLAGDPINTFSQTEQMLFTGTGSQTGSTRWGDYSAMTLDPDGCTFWFTSEYANPLDQSFNKRWKTRIFSMKYPSCTPVGAGGTVSGTVTATTGGAAISGATVQLGARSATTDVSGVYSFANVPAGIYPSITASFPGKVTGVASNISVTDGGTTTQDFSLADAPPSGCLTDTTQADFQTGVGTNTDVTTSAGDVKLARPPTLDQQNTTLGNQGAGFTTTTWLAQTFTAAVTGPVARVDLNFFSLNCGAVTMPNLTVSIRNAAANLPTGADLATATISGFCSGGGGWFTANFATPTTVTAGTQYAIVWRAASAIPGGSPAPGYFGTVSVGTGSTALQNPYAGGRRCSSGNSGATWAGATGNANNDHGFQVYLDLGYKTAGDLISSPKDSNPVTGFTPIWSTLTWNGSTPANTSLQFQAAASDSVNGPFSFVGPDGTAATFFTTSPAPLSQFYGKRYVEYRAYLATSNISVTPVLNDATVCYTDVDCSGLVATITPGANPVCANSTGNTASAPGGMTSYAWGISNGTITSPANGQTVTYTAGASGSVMLTLTVVAPNGCMASSSAPVVITVAPTTPTINGASSTCAITPTTLTATATGATSYQWYRDGNILNTETASTISTSTAGSYTVTAVNACFTSSQSAPFALANDPLPTTPTINADTNGTGTQDQACPAQPLTLHATASNATSYIWHYDGQDHAGDSTLIVTSAGDYSVTAVNACGSSATSAIYVVHNPTPHSAFLSAAGPTTFCDGGSVQLNSDSATGIQWYRNGIAVTNPPPPFQDRYVATLSGTYTVLLNALGCPSQISNSIVVTVNPIPEQPSITPGGATTFCAGNFVTLTSSSASGNQWYLDGNPINLATNDTYNASLNGNYTVRVTTNGCTSPASSPISVTVTPLPPTPTITPGGPTTFCTGGSVTLTSSSASGNQWYLGGIPLGGETGTTYNATVSGNYTVVVTANGCDSAASAPVTVTVNPIPEAPSINAGGPTTFCAGGSVTLTSSSASGNQWYLDGNPIGGQTGNTINATASGNYTAKVTTNGCTSSASSAISVTVNPIPATPTITPGGPTTFCTGGSVTLTSSSASGNQWYLNGNPIGGQTGNTYNATASGNYTVVVTSLGCSSAASAATTVTVNPFPSTPTISAGGPTTFCAGGSVTLTSSSASGNQWYLNGIPLGGQTSNTFNATASGNYTVVVTTNGCSSPASTATSVTVNPIPATPTITPSGPTTFCAGGSVTLTSSSATGNQWYINGAPLGGATGQTYPTNVAGDYTVVVTSLGCNSAASAVTTVTVNPNPNATITAPASVVSGSTGNTASVANAGAGASYNWSITGGTITAGSGTPNITFTAGATGTLTLNVTVTTSASCADAKSANITVTPAPPPVTVTAVSPNSGPAAGGTAVTITGTGFHAGATVTFGGTAATNVVVVGLTSITAKTPLHVFGPVDVKVTNTDTTTGTLAAGYKYMQLFDPNGDGVIDPADIFFLINYLFLHGPAPHGSAGMISGDANGDGVVDPADIFYLVHFIFGGGPQPVSIPSPGRVTTSSASLSGSVSLGEPVRRGNRYFVPVIVSSDGAARSLALQVRFDGDAGQSAEIHRAGAMANAQPVFEISRRAADSITYIVSYDANLGGSRPAVVAEIEIGARITSPLRLDVDPSLTMLSNDGGTASATVGRGTLKVSGTTIETDIVASPRNRE